MRVSVTEQLGNALLVYGVCSGVNLVASLDPHRTVEVGSTIRLSANLDTIRLFDPETQESLL